MAVNRYGGKQLARAALDPGPVRSRGNAQAVTRIVLFGGNGFIGSHILARLSDLQVVAPPHNEVDLRSTTDIAGILRRGDVVINAAGSPHATDRTPDGLARLRSSNVEAVANLANVGAQTGIGQLIHLSSVAAMGRVTGLGRDEEATGPITSPYAASKREAESILAEFRGKVPITILRPTPVFGEGGGLAATLCRIVQLPVVPLPGGGQTMIPFTYVKNVAGAVALSVGNDAVKHQTFVIGDAHSYPLRQIITELAHRLGSHPRIIPIPIAAARMMVNLQQLVPSHGGRPLVDPARLDTLTTSVSYSIEKFRSATGYVPPYSLADALARLADWHKARAGARSVDR